MKSTHNTLLAYLKGSALAAVMAAGTALLMAATTGGELPTPNYAQSRLDQATQTVPDQLVKLDARQAAYR